MSDSTTVPQRSERVWLGRLSRWARIMFLAAGAAMLGYCVIVVIDSWVSQLYERQQFDQALKNSKTAAVVPQSGEAMAAGPVPSTASTAFGAPSAAVAGSVIPGRGGPLGRMDIARIGLQVMIMEGIDEGTLHKAAGHIPGTAMPGERGNIAIAGHRDTLFRALRNIRQGDEITLTTLSGSMRYRVDSLTVVRPEDTEALYDNNADTLTLITCYPFSFIGSAPMRFIVRARLM
jgi:sortase A